ncbi:MAG: hypothetical protein M3R71_00165 [Actinomycetota bacterium]|nr:hypothetical protein [Actinomycetota bacterium]
MSTGYKVLVLGHLVCVIGALGALGYNGLYLTLARRRSAETAVGVLEVNSQVSGLGELLFYAAFIFGLAAVGASNSVWKFSQAWVSIAFVVFLVEVGIIHGWIRRHQRAFVRTAAGGPPEVAALDSLERRIALGWGAFNVLALVLIYLMVFKPGAPGGG